MAVMLGGSCV